MAIRERDRTARLPRAIPATGHQLIPMRAAGLLRRVAIRRLVPTIRRRLPADLPPRAVILRRTVLAVAVHMAEGEVRTAVEGVEVHTGAAVEADRTVTGKER